MKKIFYWSPHISEVATIYAVINSAKSLKRYSKTINPIIINGDAVKYKISFNEKLEFIKYLFYYVSQIKIWVGLYPFIIIQLFL